MGGMEAVDLSSGEQGQRPGSRSHLDPGHEGQHGGGERRSGPGHSHHQSSLHTDDEDSQSNKSLDLNFASKLIDFKFSSGGGAEAGGHNSQSSYSSSSSSSSVAGEEPERGGQLQESEGKLSCKVCRKSFRYAATLARHERAHLCEGSEVAFSLNSSANVTPSAEDEDLEDYDDEMDGDGERGSEGDSDSEGEEKEKEERSDEEEGGASEPKNGEGEAGGGAGKADKRKKICNVCSKRFWSLQDLTRHMRSHTGTCTRHPNPPPTGEREGKQRETG